MLELSKGHGKEANTNRSRISVGIHILMNFLVSFGIYDSYYLSLLAPAQLLISTSATLRYTR